MTQPNKQRKENETEKKIKKKIGAQKQ